MDVLHISPECYPAAKAGGLGDVAGALPKYSNQLGVPTGVIIPKYRTKWIQEHTFDPLFRGVVRVGGEHIPFAVEEYQGRDLGFPLFVVDLPGKYDRPGIYLDQHGNGYGDEVERAISFQLAVLRWVQFLPHKPKVLHCHDHHTGLIPFLIKHALQYNSLANIPTVFTVHNGEYHGSFRWNKVDLLPAFDSWKGGLLDWQDVISPLAAGIKCCWRFTTVSPGYLDELKQSANGLESLFREEAGKSVGILNGIDTKVWDPVTDPLIAHRWQNMDLGAFKWANKQELARRFQINPHLPLVTFIGRLVREKGADLLPSLFGRYVGDGGQMAFVVLGTGRAEVENSLAHLRHLLPGYFDASLEYNEALAHQLYAGSDFLFMPSRVEPCGLNQMYAMRYGTVPIVRAVGGLRDTIPDIGDRGGRGIRFLNFTLEDAAMALFRGQQVYHDMNAFNKLRHRVVQVDLSWERSAREYAKLYQTVTTS